MARFFSLYSLSGNRQSQTGLTITVPAIVADVGKTEPFSLWHNFVPALLYAVVLFLCAIFLFILIIVTGVVTTYTKGSIFDVCESESSPIRCFCPSKCSDYGGWVRKYRWKLWQLDDENIWESMLN
ncbi:hypothetical protein CEXT_348141 [Caerostris extrusa]|uniref:Uncharacterized protein n=1 Tax=Caerostris extrusa TaxID=172846 RepID=A0AAV4MN16_CAEEX|nr:hypothetical protein CEXT_348141 [Caerostris extrusa]